MRKLLLILSFVIGWHTLIAKEITREEAMQKASDFLNKSSMKKQKASGPAYQLAYTSRSSKANLFYVFNRGKNDGFIVVSADDRAKDILAYADSGYFNELTLPENMKWLLSEYEKEIQFLIESGIDGIPAVKSPALTKDVYPLLNNLMWDQGDPYNKFCPIYSADKRSATGCVATAMAQIMYYYKWPLQGTGSFSYTWNEQMQLSADFGNTTYEWNKMTPAYSTTSSQESIDAVATLMSHCGISVEMNYGASSGAITANVPKRLRQYFKYDIGSKFIDREFYSIDEWNSIIRNELDNDRPVLYSGRSKTGGHAFILDGYNKDGYFHINWGWSGSSNGYFLTTALTPGAQGIGGSNGGYNYNQAIGIGIQKPQQGAQYKYELVMQDGIRTTVQSQHAGKAVPITVGYLKNRSLQDLNLFTYLTLTDESGTVISDYGLHKGVTFPSFYGLKEHQVNYVLPPGIKDGNYRLFYRYSHGGSGEKETVRINAGKSKALYVSVKDGMASYKAEKGSILKVTTIDAVSRIISGKAMSVKVQLDNLGENEYYGAITFALFNNKNELLSTSNEHVTDVMPGMSIETELIGLAAGSAGSGYLVIYDKDNSAVSDPFAVMIEEMQGSEALEVGSRINYRAKDKNGLIMSVQVRNNGSYFAGTLKSYVFPKKGGLSEAVLHSDFVVLDQNQTKEVTFKGSHPSGISGNEYFCLVRDPNNSKWMESSYAREYFVMDEPLSIKGLSDSEMKIYPNPANEYINIESVYQIDQVIIYSISGQEVLTVNAASNRVSANISTLNKGSYIVHIHTESGNVVRKLIKN